MNEKLQELLTSEDPYVRQYAVSVGKLTPEQQERALTDVNPYVRAAAVKIGNLTPEQRERAMNDSYQRVCLAKTAKPKPL